MHLGHWKKLKQINELQNKWWTYRTDEIELPSGKPGEYHYVHTNGSSLVVPVTGEGKIIMVRQYRYLAERDSLEFPCGSVKNGSSYEETAKLEFAEEAGVEAGEIFLAGRFNPYNGVTDEMCNVYVVRGLKDVFVPHDDTEEFEKVTLPISEVESKIKSNEIWDGMSLAAWLIAKDHL
ncbi:MAG: NUDIX hydrolase [Bacteroidetes bacterium]|nr:NUDIX hydrolase [Bacteroidota bacterium]MBU1423133.1 NUDIX hydrolase [Bacteroidota bacterium]MBU2472173.1 NUDIX hydrolase [Bacteroidota bacterium]